MYPEDLQYTREHEWVRIENGVATVGITEFAQDQLGDIADVVMPDVDASVESMKECGAIESVKTASDLFSPVSGRVCARNERLMSRLEGRKNPDFHPELVNEDPYGEGWLFKIELAPDSGIELLLDAAAYTALVG